MRRSNITDRVQRSYFNKTGARSQDQELMLNNTKIEPSRLQENNFISARSPLPSSYNPRHAKHLLSRPDTTTKKQSLLDYKNSHGTSHTARHDPAKDLSIYSMREQHQRDHRSSHQDNSRMEHSKGRLYRGGSWKYDDKPFKEGNPVPARYHHAHQSSHNPHSPHAHLSHHRQSQKRDLSVYESYAEGQRSKKSGGLTNLMGGNMWKSSLRGDDEFFEYIMRFSYRTKKGYIPSNSGKVNQDSYIVNPNLNNHTWQHFFAVCDGHGPLGHQVSGYIKAALPQAIANSKGLESNPKQALTRAFEIAYQRLLKESRVDLNFSGSTVIGCYFNQNRLVCANVGDSRAILGRCRSGNWESLALSDDHKPCVPKEAERIRRMKGRIEAFKDENGQPIGPMRVWLQDDNVPGLAMSRSFGDLVAASVGVSPIPEMKEFSLTEQDRIVVIGSDGVFQFLQNEAIIKSLIPFYESKLIQQASDHLMTMATKSWNRNSSVIDDITFILIFISYNEI